MTSHGESYSEEYRHWVAMIVRCEDADAQTWQNYGGRGIRVCDRWRNSVESFIEDVGRKPTSRHSLDRIDNNGNYEPGNVRWATKEQQGRNRRNNVCFLLDGKKVCLSELAAALGINRSTLRQRLERSGWPLFCAVMAP